MRDVSLLPSSFLISDVVGPFDSVAVVGNAPRLMDGAHGAEIDAHDVVIRINDGRTTGFERHAGVRTSLRFVGIPLKPRFHAFFRELDEPSIIVTRVENQPVLEKLGWSGKAAYVMDYRSMPSRAFAALATLVDIPATTEQNPRTGMLVLSLLTDAFRARKKVSLYGIETAVRPQGAEHFYDDGRTFAATLSSYDKYHCPIDLEFDALAKLQAQNYISLT